MKRFRLHLHDELYPYVKSGKRTVIAKIGWKWAHIQYKAATGRQSWKKIARKKWDALAKEQLNA